MLQCVVIYHIKRDLWLHQFECQLPLFWERYTEVSLWRSEWLKIRHNVHGYALWVPTSIVKVSFWCQVLVIGQNESVLVLTCEQNWCCNFNAGFVISAFNLVLVGLHLPIFGDALAYLKPWFQWISCWNVFYLLG